jgi:hypothetical protein
MKSPIGPLYSLAFNQDEMFIIFLLKGFLILRSCGYRQYHAGKQERLVIKNDTIDKRIN